ncbi:NADH:flavin oxidoreductase/NADH oxidase family protein [Acinetobacter indicus]|uniref:NADH:flavin oxidoreductase/NADH oxidase family protein n=1 Tax=Acinetobacter TaxID=469 RepID=UPI000948F60E|nr:MULTISPECIES: NADH:flavin oxidoreductase/NADH oxidase family protein [Acinetobacter]MCO8088032.1 NADH:flavin oxidoreductase/NADH oxidase family protein [Acinetobacter indicus]MCO8098974.1 NADH:flavin oxidoreductase/NADH oxidase family protein [Acinetobacter indicus]MCO8104671.1 NADH:flavin oxidoreductase/NADH oxidase family protein [Acinetobacter indicus]MCO8110252.1 NADH:flavin oxidoreductase/NADH oxidase family protein [Acinetobacter indicus]MCP0915912.1 NADH:flavin oxidoreductase/NADH ox
MSQIADQLQIRKTTFKNRIIKGAMSEALANTAGQPNQLHLGLYEAWAKGGLGCAITGNVMVDIRAKNEPGVVAIESERDLAKLQQWAQIGKQYGMVQLVQLSHPGRQCPKGLNKETVAPSAVPFSPALATTFGTPRELREDEILDIIQRFARAAQICEQAGFEGVQLHGAHGYLISQFLSPLTNKRQDRWGGSIDNRMRFLLEIYQAVRAATSEDFIISVKLNSADFQRGGISEEDVIQVFKAIDAAGIDLIEVSGGTYEAPAMAGVKAEKRKASTLAREAYFLEFAERIRQEVRCHLMVTGGFRTVQGMNTALASGACDFIGIARPFAVEPDLAHRLLAGQDVRYGVDKIKTGIPLVDKMAIMEIIWYAAQFKDIAQGKQPNPKLSPLKVFFKYLKGNLTAVIKGQINSRKSA